MHIHHNKEQLLTHIERSAAQGNRVAFKKALNLYALDSKTFLNDLHNQSSTLYQLAHRHNVMDDQQKLVALVFGMTSLIPLAGLAYWYETPYSPSGMVSGIVSSASLHLLYAYYYQTDLALKQQKREIAQDILSLAEKITSPRRKPSLLQTEFLEHVIYHYDESSISHNVGSCSK